MKKNILLLSLLLFIHCNKSDHLEEMNNIKMPLYEELISNVSSKDTLKILTVGNSITSHGIANNIGWKHKSGMAATNIENDYIHILFNRLKEQYPNKNINFRYSNWSEFERSPEAFNRFNMVEKFNPDIFIFQLSDNTIPETLNVFEKKSISFLQGVKSEKFVVSPFFMNSSNYGISKKIAIKSNSIFIDISSISKNRINKASNDLRNDKSEWKSEGIGEHPGNTGMINISNTIFNYIKASKP